jgi:peptidoglycan/LPS O-acetylase OafA/YrhL
MTELPATPPATRPHRGSRLGYLPALDGARALAVAGVIVYHLDIGLLPGGFLGVDLFFVLSGYLITTLLLREHAMTHGIDLVQFWLRRARRLLPALFLVIGAIALVAASSSPFDRFALRWDILSSLGYVTNWRFILAGQSYFQEFAAPSPVLHLWSLAIEEQFYALWPLLSLLGLGLAARHRRVNRALPWVLVAAIGASVVAMALTWNEANPSTAYYATHTRAHELLIGALAALLSQRSAAYVRLARRFAAPVAGAALAVLVAFAILLDDASPVYYFGGSLAFSIAAAAMISSLAAAAGERGDLVGRALSVRPLPWIGAISYGLYLWHWPMILWLTPTSTGATGPLLVVLRVGATLAASALSFYLVERPIRHGSLGGLRLQLPQVVAGAAAAVIVLSALTIYNTRGAEPLPEFARNNRKLIVHEVPSAKGTVGLVGDSVAMSLSPGLAYEAASSSRSLVIGAFPGCPIGVVEHVSGRGQPFAFAKRCPSAVVKGQTQMARRYDPDVVFWLSNRDRLPVRVNGQVLPPGTPDWETASFADWDAALARLTANGATLVLILPFHQVGDDPAACTGDDVLAADCALPQLSTNSLRYEYSRWASTHPNSVVVIDPDPLLCPANPCPAVAKGVPLFGDSVHLTENGARLVASWLVGTLPRDVWR